MKKHINSKLFAIRLFILASFLVAFHSDTQLNQYILPIAAYSVSSADIDLDGDLDILVGHLTAWSHTNPTVSILTNFGGVYTISDTAKSYCGYQVNIFACKIDNDQNPDLVTFYSDFSTGTMKRFLRIWFSQDGNFNNFQDYNLNSSATFDGITNGDVNGDGLIDILVYSSNSHFWGVLYNLGNGFLSLPEYHNETGNYPSNIACGDLNGDGRDDVVVSGQITRVYYSLPTGFQQEVLELNDYKDMLAIVDFDGDGDNDLLTATFANRLVMYRNLNDTALQVLPWVSTLISSMNIAAVDFNNDNLPDIAFLTMYPDTTGTGITDTIGGINIFYNLGDFQLSDPQFISLTNYDESGRNFHAADFDGNGYNDFAIIRALTNQTSTLELLFNDGNGSFTGTPVGMYNRLDKSTSESLSCYPNPFHESTSFEFILSKTAQVDLSVYDLNGRLIQCITNKKLAGGCHVIKWQGHDKASILPKSNVLIVCLKVDGKSCQSSKLIWY
jgi:hypothetical protein